MKSIPCAPSCGVTEPAPEVSPAGTLANEELVAVAALWKRTGREFVTRFRGASMEPTIPDSAAVRVRCVDDVAVGDVVAYIDGDRVIVHRVVAVWRSRFVTRGDANLLPDTILLDRNGIIGKLVSVERGGEWLLPPARPAAAAASLLLWFCTMVVGIGGIRTAQRLLGVMRAVRQRLRAVRGTNDA